MENVIDASERFGPRSNDKPKVSLLERLRSTGRNKQDDAVLMARQIGRIAEKLNPARPQAVAKQWFDALWDGERWNKRKRLVLFEGEIASDPMTSSGADWAALIEHAAKALFPDSSSTSFKERERVYRDVLRGTSYLPSTAATPLRSDSAQKLLADLAARTCDAIEARTEIVRLWEALEQTPFEVYSYDDEQPVYADESNGELVALLRAQERYDGDRYSLSPLGKVAGRGNGVIFARYNKDLSYRFEPSTDRGLSDWCYPYLQLGIVGNRHQSRIFVIPHGFAADLPLDQAFEDGEKTEDERVTEWLVMQGIVKDERYATLPEISFSKELGYGWTPFVFDAPTRVTLEVRARSDGSPGLWITSQVTDYTFCYPVVRNLDTLAAEASREKKAWFSFLPSLVHDSWYEYLQWPSYDPKFMDGPHYPEGAYSGLLDNTALEMPDIEGWIDDLENVELQEFIFRLPSDARFCPSIAVDDEVPPPCRPGTIAAAIFENAGCDPADRVAMQLLKQAETIAECGLEFHSALLAVNRARIEGMIEGS